jgi:lipopolysaccharide/colanic/teichoic acid biosynthesis glycosyltransferase
LNPLNLPKILVVDDDPDTCHMVSFMLERNQYHVDIAYGGEEAIEKMQSLNPDLVVLDLMMPDIDGFETCRRMKAERNIPILLLSALTDITSVSEGFTYGGDDYVCKPFQSRELTLRIDNLLHHGTFDRKETTNYSNPHTHLGPDLSYNDVSKRFYQRIKRVMDILIAAMSLILLSPLILFTAILLRFDSPGPVIFKQKRVRRKEKKSTSRDHLELETFTCYKFRTMYQGTTPDTYQRYLEASIQSHHDHTAVIQKDDNKTRKLTSDPRITKFGKFLRRSSIDEIPQFWNVLKGDMSIVGPRPPIQYEVEMYKPWHRTRLRAKPGMTGLWQVTTRSSADFDELVRIDNWYYEHQTLWLDLKILLKTPFSTLRRDETIESRRRIR